MREVGQNKQHLTNATGQSVNGEQQLDDNNFGFPGKSPSEPYVGQFLLDQSHLENLINEFKQELQNSKNNGSTSYVSPNGDIFWLWTSWPGLNAVNLIPGWSQFQQHASAYTSSYSGPVQTVAQQLGLNGFVDQTVDNPFAYYANPANHPWLVTIQNLPNLADIPMIFINGIGQRA